MRARKRILRDAVRLRNRNRICGTKARRPGAFYPAHWMGCAIGCFWPIGDASEIEGQPPPHDMGLPEILLRIDASIREDTEKHAADGRRECLTRYAGHSTYSREGVADTSEPVPSMPLRNV